MKRFVLIIISVLALLAVSCGTSDVGSSGSVGDSTGDDASTTTTQPPAGDDAVTTTTQPPDDDDQTDPPDTVDQAFVKVYFVHDGLTARSVIRSVDEPGVAAGAIEALIAGPTAEEQTNDLYSAIPADTLLLGLTIEDGLATIDLSREFEVGGGSFNILSRLAQVVYTLTEFSTVDDVLFHLDGEPVDVFSGEGVVLDHPVDRDDYATILPAEQDDDTAAGEPWSQADLPDVTGADTADLSRVTGVADDDTLNVRQDPTVEAPIVGSLLPNVVVKRTGEEQITGSSLWVQIETPAGDFWVNDMFLTAVS
jgi:hypothetical protein